MFAQAALPIIMTAGLLYMIGARRLAGRAFVLALVLIFLGCLLGSLSVHISAIDSLPVAVIGALLLVGLVGAGIFYARMRRARRSRKASDPVRPFAPEPVPAVHSLGEERPTVHDADRGEDRP